MPHAPQTDTATADSSEREKLEALVRQHDGNRSAIAAALTSAGQPITRQAVTKKLQRVGLIALADDLALSAKGMGQRNHVSPEAEAEDRSRILQALAKAKTYDEAAAPLEMSVPTLYRRIAKYKIKRAEVAREKKRLADAAARKSPSRRSPSRRKK